VEPTIAEITMRYHACAVELANALGVPYTEAFLIQHRESISCCFIESSKLGVRLPERVHLPPLKPAEHSGVPVAGDTVAEFPESVSYALPVFSRLLDVTLEGV
jgi:hypothetical protein